MKLDWGNESEATNANRTCREESSIMNDSMCQMQLTTWKVERTSIVRRSGEGKEACRSAVMKAMFYSFDSSLCACNLVEETQITVNMLFNYCF